MERNYQSSEEVIKDTSRVWNRWTQMEQGGYSKDISFQIFQKLK